MKIFKHLTANAINLVPFDFLRELSMEAYLIENEAVLALDNEEFDEVTILADELSILSARKSKASDGRIDLVAYYSSSNTLAVIELKKGTISCDNIEQLTDYLKERSQILAKIQENNPEISDPNWIGILAGTSISSDLIKHIEDGGKLDINDTEIPVSALTIKRYKSDDGQFFIATDTYQNIISTSNKDYTKYFFNSNEYGKGRLILAVLQKHAQDNPTLTFAEFKSIFPDKIQGSHGVFASKENADKENSKGRTRYLTKADELIQLNDAVIAVSNQWYPQNIDKAIKTFRGLGYELR